MSYRGKDLDLRTGEPARATGSRSNSRPSQVQARGSEFDIQAVLYVEDAVLACCNHAYDLALAYRAPEVRLEHLINAMTRTDAAVAVMAAQGIDITSLRHDTATMPPNVRRHADRRTWPMLCIQRLPQRKCDVDRSASTISCKLSLE
jgi:hypothetical protein